MSVLDQMIGWIDEVPPLPQANQRFGNLAFRQYIKLVEEVRLSSIHYRPDPNSLFPNLC
jgi:hypothetical protein